MVPLGGGGAGGRLAAGESVGMVTDTDIWRTAKLLLDRHGADAPIHAAMRADALLAKGDVQGQAVWLRVLVPPPAG